MKDQLGYDLIGAAMEVYNTMGSGFLEEVYQECLEKELAAQSIGFCSQHRIALFYKDALLQKVYVADFFIGNAIIAEIKAVSALSKEHHAQLLNYLYATKVPVGYLINFGKEADLEWKRINISNKLSDDKRR
jgi:GxxExxY protein